MRRAFRCSRVAGLRSAPQRSAALRRPCYSCGVEEIAEFCWFDKRESEMLFFYWEVRSGEARSGRPSAARRSAARAAAAAPGATTANRISCPRWVGNFDGPPVANGFVRGSGKMLLDGEGVGERGWGRVRVGISIRPQQLRPRAKYDRRRRRCRRVLWLMCRAASARRNLATSLITTQNIRYFYKWMKATF